MFITFEGGEGCGKSTHAKLLEKYLSGLGYKVLLTREPGATIIGKKIRQILLKSKGALPRQSEFFLFCADRVMHVEEIIKPALKANKIVISDRYTDSSIAYQVGGRGLPVRFVENLNKISSGGIIPQITFYLDLSYAQALKRLHIRRRAFDRFEKEKAAFHARIRKKYLSIARENNKRVIIIKPIGSIAKVQANIRKAIDRILNEKR